ncbi:hypothetical protein B2J93_6560 [Marssonina coronariae]|uniref:SET domain-containing protein n=1 Tax=Diplocarpon coronariae TaxID=2795749 RepID=A0A218Z0H1_9HELO|nr:hypothetical protein B2J93_6560 [Marssonina coronariae]
MAPSSTSTHASPVRSSEKNRGRDAATALWKVVDIPGKGKGLIVTRDIKPGTLLLSEAPLITTDVVSHLDTAEQDLSNALGKLSLGDQDSLRALHNNFPENPDQLCGILQSNGYPMGAECGGLFPAIARINHSCLPNSVQHWNELLGKLTIHAVRPIAAGEEVTTTYKVPGASAARKKLLKENFRFDCVCELCSLPADELRASDERITRQEELREIIGDSKTVYYKPDEVIRCARSLFDLYEQDGIKDGRLSSLFYDLFQICNMHSDLARARCFAKYYSDAAKIAEGEDSINVLDIKPYIKNPQKHDSFFSTKKWETKTSDVPKGLKPGAFATWLWRESI